MSDDLKPKNCWQEAADIVRSVYKEHDQDIKPFWFCYKLLDLFEQKAKE